MTVPVDPIAPAAVAPAPAVAPVQVVEWAMVALEGLAGRPPAEHVEAFERVHAALAAALAVGAA